MLRDALTPAGWLLYPRLSTFGTRYFADEGGDGGGAGGAGDPDPGADPDAEADAEKKRLIAESKKYRKRAQDVEAQLETLQGKVLSDEDRALFAQLRETEAKRKEDENRKAGAWDTMKAELVADCAKKVEAAEAKADRYLATLRQVIGTDQLKSALAARSVTRVDQAAYLLGSQVQVEIDDEKGPVVRVVNEQGQPILDPEAQGVDTTITIEKLVDNWLAKDGSHFLPPSGDTGSGSHRGGGGAEQVTLEQLDSDPARKAKLIQEDPDRYMKMVLGARKNRQTQRKQKE